VKDTEEIFTMARQELQKVNRRRRAAERSCPINIQCDIAIPVRRMGDQLTAALAKNR
jgi:hypothetical protein